MIGSNILRLTIKATPIINIHFWDHVYLRHIGRSGDQHIDRHSADVSVKTQSSVGRHVVLVNRPSVDAQSTPRPICCDRQSLVYRSIVGDVSVDC